MGNAMTFKLDISDDTLDNLTEELQRDQICDAHLHEFADVKAALEAFLNARIHDLLDDISRSVKRHPDDFADALPDLPNPAYDENAEHLREYYRNLGVPTRSPWAAEG
jgi:hypothetical protein